MYFVQRAMSTIERQPIPRIGMATTRRALRLLTTVYNDEAINAWVCFVCGEIHSAMHGPELSYYRHDGSWNPARINFTANAVAGQVGGGLRAIRTLFHEGGHAAHFSNILAKAPCFSHEFAPTSVAYAETQSMFLDSLLGDADWRRRYAKDKDGNAMPVALIEKAIRE